MSHVSKSFGKKEIIRDLSLSVEDGERICIIGPSGCGKSTLLKLLTGLSQVDKGHIRIGHQHITGLNEKELYKIRENIGFVFQSSALFDSLNVESNISFALQEKVNKQSDIVISDRVKEMLELVGMSGYEKAMPSDLSGGQQKRIGLARALANRPKIVLYDEPTAGLDPQLCTNIENLIVDLSKKLKVTSIIISHQISTMLRTPEKIYFMHEGQFLAPESPESIKNSTQEAIHAFFKGVL
jgi:phospholipid/cholesterol/gamma-HCH transport system ATP-binding protein